MRVARLSLFASLVAASLALAAGARGQGEGAAERGACVLRAELDGIVSAGTADYLTEAIEVAEARCGAALIVIDTPGGELEATRAIVSSFLGAEVPVVTYVAPSGARAGSAGVFLVMAGHVAAMTPGTNIGAAHPVIGLGGDPEEGGEELGEKVVNDTAAFARAIAERRGRNVEWAERAVRESVSVTASEAVARDIVDRLAPSEEALLGAIDGRTVRLPGGREVTLETEGAAVVRHEMSLRQKALSILGDPNLAYLLFMIGMLGLLIELFQPGLIIPGAVGAFSLLLGAIGLNILPVNIGAVVLLVAGLGLLIAELFIASYGLLALGGVAALVTGSLLLVDRGSEEFFADASVSVSWTAVVPLVLLLVGTAAALAWFGTRMQRRVSPTGAEGLVGQVGDALSEVGARGGRVRLEGERWRARSEEAIPAGSRIRVEEVRGLTLVVSRADQEGEHR